MHSCVEQKKKVGKCQKVRKFKDYISTTTIVEIRNKKPIPSSRHVNPISIFDRKVLPFAAPPSTIFYSHPKPSRKPRMRFRYWKWSTCLWQEEMLRENRREYCVKQMKKQGKAGFRWKFWIINLKKKFIKNFIHQVPGFKPMTWCFWDNSWFSSKGIFSYLLKFYHIWGNFWTTWTYMSKWSIMIIMDRGS